VTVTPTNSRAISHPVAHSERRVSGRRVARGFALHAAVLLVCAVWLIPTISLLITSVRPAALMLSSGWWHIFTSPAQFTISNYREVLETGVLGRSFVNSLVIVVPATIASVLIGAIAGYVFAWMRFPGESLVLILIVGLLALPVQVTLVPVLQIFSSLDLAGRFAAAWIAYTAYILPFAIYLMRSFFRKIPQEIIEAAQVDGASPSTIWLRIAMPIAAPALASLATLVFVWTWNDLLVSLVYLGSGPSVAPMPVTIANLIGSQGQGQELLAAGAIISLLLPVGVFFALQRFFVRGIAAGAVKG
jgi:alpha-glucoside transport system permease protein